MNGLPSDFAERRAGKEVNASIQIGVTSEGIYRVTYSSLTNAGVAVTNLVGSMMRLFCRTQEIAILVSNTNQWMASDYLLFPGQGYDGYYSTTNVYWLGFGAGGKRMGTRSAVPDGSASLVTSYRKTALYHKDRSFFDSYRWDDDTLDHWIDEWFLPGPEYERYLQVDHLVTNDPAMFQAVMLGNIWAHCTQVKIKNTVIGRFFYDGAVTALMVTSFPATLLQANNTNTFQQLTNLTSVSDVAGLERYSLTYSRTLWQEGNTLLYEGGSGSNSYLVRGFASSNGFTAFDVTDPAEAVILAGGSATNMGAEGYALRFMDISPSPSRYTVCNLSGIKDVAQVQRVYFRELDDLGRRADYVVICPSSFREQVYRLMKLRYLQGLSVAVAPLPDIFNQFSYGIKDASAIKQFIGYAFHHWASPPKYVVLAGTGNRDPLGIEPGHTNHSPDIIPVHLGPGYQLWSSLDGWYASVSDTDNVPDVALGRIPVETAAELKNVVDKIVSLEGTGSNSLWRAYAAVAADKNDLVYSNYFTVKSDILYNMFQTNGFPVPHQFYQDSGSGSADLVQEINDDVFYLNFYGHGTVTDWAGSPRFFSTNNISQLTNTKYPVISMMTCENGDFAGVGFKCLVEAFLEPANRGASACVASSSLATLQGAEVFINEFYDQLVVERKLRIGDALLPAYKALFWWSKSGRSVLYYELFGDPAMIVNP